MWLKLEAVHLLKLPATRFNTYNIHLNITKADDESLSSLILRVADAKQSMNNAGSKIFTLEDLDADLSAMALIRALPDEYSSFVSSLLLLPTFGYEEVKAAFYNEEQTRISRSDAQTMATLANRVVHDSSAPKHSSNSTRSTPSSNPHPPHSTPRPPKPPCDFCGRTNHTFNTCWEYQAAQKKAKGGTTNTSSTSGQPRTNTHSAYVSVDDEENAVEHAGSANAGIASLSL